LRLARHLLDGDALDDLAQLIKERRPVESPWIGASLYSTVVEVFGEAPATAMAFAWLAKDLMKHHWLVRLPSRF
jgi:hypothetical protein